MPDILHDFPINAPAKKVFDAISTPAGLDTWWTKESSGTPAEGEEYELHFGPPYDWRAVVTRCAQDKEFEFTITHADHDWQNTKVGFTLNDNAGMTQVRFRHVGWPAENDHYRTSCYCWAMYLRVLRRNLEKGETVPYELRLDV